MNFEPASRQSKYTLATVLYTLVYYTLYFWYEYTYDAALLATRKQAVHGPALREVQTSAKHTAAPTCKNFRGQKKRNRSRTPTPKQPTAEAARKQIARPHTSAARRRAPGSRRARTPGHGRDAARAGGRSDSAAVDLVSGLGPNHDRPLLRAYVPFSLGIVDHYCGRGRGLEDYR